MRFGGRKSGKRASDEGYDASKTNVSQEQNVSASLPATPPGHQHGRVAGLMMNARPYQLMIDTRLDSSRRRAMIKDLMSGLRFDGGVLWGPD